MTRTKRDAHEELPPTFETLDQATLDEVTGGINWRYQATRAALAISQWDPAMVAANFIM